MEEQATVETHAAQSAEPRRFFPLLNRFYDLGLPHKELSSLMYGL